VSWLALGSLGRREVMPSSDADTGLVWHGEDADPELRRATGALAARVMAVLERCGLAADEHGVRADRPLFARSEDAWEAAFLEWAGDPEQPKVLIAVSVMLDGRVVWGAQGDAPLLPALARAAQRPALVRLLARSALSHRPPTGFRRALVVEHSGEHRGRLDVKRGGMLPIADLARWAGLAAGSSATATVERLRAGAEAGVLSAEQARTLEEAWDLVLSLRLEHQLALVRAGRPPHDHLDPQELNPLTRRYLREAFRSVAAVQRDVANELSPGSRW
jgi:CBS domain-containing protein